MENNLQDKIKKMISEINSQVGVLKDQFSQQINTSEIMKPIKLDNFDLGFEKPKTKNTPPNTKSNQTIISILNSEEITKINNMFQKNVIERISSKGDHGDLACVSIIEGNVDYYQKMIDLFENLKSMIDEHIQSINRLQQSNSLELSDTALKEIENVKRVKSLLNSNINAVLISLTDFENKIKQLKQEYRSKNKTNKKCSFTVTNKIYNEMLSDLNIIYKNIDIFVVLQKKCLNNPILIFENEETPLEDMKDSKRDDKYIYSGIKDFKSLFQKYMEKNMFNVSIIPDE